VRLICAIIFAVSKRVLKTLEAAVDKFPTKWELWDRLSDAYKAKGDHDEAIKTSQAAVNRSATEWGLWHRLRDAL